MKMKKILPIAVILAILIMNLGNALAAPVSERPWEEWVYGGDLRDRAVSSAEAAILIEANSGRILFDKRANQTMYPASITKIMTAILAIENSDLTDIVYIDNTMAEIIMTFDDAAMCGFQKSESVYMEDLLYGLLLLSGADAAVAIAVHVGGTYENFIQMMNDKADELGMTKTVYKNPTGLYQSGHVTCAEDMAILTQYANKFPAFAKIVSTGKYTPTDTDKHQYSERGKVWYNSNKLVNGNSTYGYDFATGVKTGFTTPSGHTLVTSAEKDNVSLIGVVLKDTANGKWVNSVTMFEYGFKYYDTIDLAAVFSEREIVVDVENAASTTDGSQLILQFAPVEKVYLTESIDMVAEIRANIDEYFTVDIQYYQDPLIAPIEKGQEVGIITFTYIYDHYYSDYLQEPLEENSGIKKIVYQAYLIAANNVDAMPTVIETVAPQQEDSDETTGETTGEGDEETGLGISKTLIYFAGGLLALAVIMILSSYLTRRYRYQQYYVTNKTKKEKRRNDDDDNDDSGTIKFNY